MTHPTLKKYPKGYYEWLDGIIQKESWAEWAKKPNAPLPTREKGTLKLTKATAFSFSKNFIKIICI